MLLESDNTVVVVAVRSGFSKDVSIMPLLRTLQFLAGHFGFVWTAKDDSDDDKIICIKAARDCEEGLQLLRKKDNVPVVSDDFDKESGDSDADEEMLTSANKSEIESSKTENK